MPDAMVENLPIDAILPDLCASLIDNPSAVLAAPPGAGKTTRVPLALRDAPWREGRRIVMLEPRRIAARAAAERLAEQLGERPGQSVGYRIRGESRRGMDIEVVTEGILTRMIQSDPELSEIAAVLFDEAHERSIHSDLGLALALDLQSALRPDLRLVVMSATLDTTRYAQLMNNAPVLESAGRTYPVETHWLDAPWQPRNPRRGDFERAAVKLIERAIAETNGDVLVFLPGVPEIERVKNLLDPPGVAVHPLHGRLPFLDQRKVLARDGGTRRVILSTAIAETSLTVPGIRTVVDTGRARRAIADPATGLSRLVTTPVSRAQADQRRGRAGRLGPGACYRMWTRGQEGGFPLFAPPEILETDLAALVLELAAWGVSTPSELKFIDEPPENAFNTATDLLIGLGALDANKRITDHGRAIAIRGLSPRLAHMLLKADQEEQPLEAGLIAALLQERAPLGSTTDLRSQIEAVLGQAGGQIAGTARIRDEAKRIAKGLPTAASAIAALPRLIIRAYPDRIAKRRLGEQPRFLLANGRGAFLPADDTLASCAYLVATDLQDDREARIRLAVPVTEDDIRATLGDAIRVENEVAWNEQTNSIDARTSERVGALNLKVRPWADAPPSQIASALAKGVSIRGVSRLPWSSKAQRLRQRITWLRKHSERVDLPDMSDDALNGSVEDWLAPHLVGLTKFEHVASLDLTTFLFNMLTWEQRQAVDHEAPEAWTTPLGKTVPIDWDMDSPAISVRVQEVFGLKRHPTIGKLLQPLVLHLLSPAGRLVQTTSNLPRFWETSYADVRKDMRARYPKHPWPEDPASAQATTRTKRHGTGTEK